MTSLVSKRPNMRIPLNFAQLSFEISYVIGIGNHNVYSASFDLVFCLSIFSESEDHTHSQTDSRSVLGVWISRGDHLG